MARQGGRRANFNKGGSESGESNSTSRGTGRGGGRSGNRPSGPRKAVFRPSVRALPVGGAPGDTAAAQANLTNANGSKVATEQKERISGHPGLLLVNRKLSNSVGT
ncbi:hypothetical protein EC988_005122, partial [Linderina pennispora]